MTHVTFPGLGLEFTINRIAFTIPIGNGINVYWYGILIAVGIVLAFIYFLWRARKYERISEDDCYNITLFTVPIAIVGARFLYVVTNLDSYPDFKSMISVWNGGLAIYGAIIFGFITILVYCKVRKITVTKVLDAVAPAVMIGQILGRWGNFCNGEAYGWSEHVANMPWRMTVDGATYTTVIDGIKTVVPAEFVHPTFLYESLWNIAGFVLINLLYKNKRFSGQSFLTYVAWYGFGRGFIELLRTDSLYVAGIKLNSFIGFASCAVAIVLLVLLSRRSSRETAEVEAYEQAYAASSEAESGTASGTVSYTASDTASEPASEAEHEPEDKQ